MSVPGQNTAIYITPPAGDASQTLVVGTGGTLDVSAGTVAGTIVISTLPTSDPHNVGQLWNSSGAVHVSAG